MNEEINEKEKEKKEKRSPALKILVVVVIIIIFVIALIIIGDMLKIEEINWKTVESVNGEIRINVSEVDDGELHYYKMKNSDDGFFILKAPDDEIKTRFSICEPCQGYSFHLEKDGKNIVCDKCGTIWDTSEFKGISGGCINDPPPRLESQIDSGFIIIKESDL